ncbi:hypothetical protein [Halococcus salifodinae]|uniref:hypothetical protein n=1 Tax=Halococcus salifodinae TaxID=36738 RepID=UPI000677DA5A|nr:hypothetical protein [Halococcus salifodinae]
MSDERPTIRPVTLARLVETSHICEDGPRTLEDIKSALDVTHRRARETTLETLRIGLLGSEQQEDEDETYESTHIGDRFLEAVRAEEWSKVSDVLATQSPHYSAFLEALDNVAPASLEAVLEELESLEEFTNHSYNQTSVEVVGDWAERLGTVQRNSFTGGYYSVERNVVPSNFPFALLAVYDDLEETAGVDLRQRYLSIPLLREHFCERHGCPRSVFDEALRRLAQQNVGHIELSGAPMDTGAKEAQLGIKEIDLGSKEGLVTTDQSTERVMAGIEQFGKQYYYLAVYDRNLTFTQEKET